ncbi:hypothetical protein HYC85_004043 [Camellia sinensis]|uniref:CCHC-type domain-containing protein n=1 Tax=Camellia sinensis TaxID=4442 RepID=A0A7J7HY19_CAMSI|nr:hypothetical protein HYC85_004043 [Camellia sinensis]
MSKRERRSPLTLADTQQITLSTHVSWVDSETIVVSAGSGGMGLFSAATEELRHRVKNMIELWSHWLKNEGNEDNYPTTQWQFKDAIAIEETNSICLVNECGDFGFLDLRSIDISVRWCLNNSTNREILGNRIGRLVRVEAHTEGLIRVEIDTQQPLPRGLWLHRGQGQSNSWLTFKYEKLSDFCYDCGRLGHENHTCKFVSKEQGASFGYGPGLRTGNAGPTSLPIEHYHRRVDDLEASLSLTLTSRRTAVPPPPLSKLASDNPDQGPTSQPELFLPRSSSSTLGTPMRTTPEQEQHQNTPSPALPSGGPTPTTSVSDSRQLHSFLPSPVGPVHNPLIVMDHTAHPLIQVVDIGQPTKVGLPTDTNYYITEPPDSPCHSGALQGMNSKFLPAPLGDTGPLNPAHPSEGGLSIALQQLSLKRKVIGELEWDLHRTKVQKVGLSVPLLKAPSNTHIQATRRATRENTVDACKKPGRRGRSSGKRVAHPLSTNLVEVLVQDAVRANTTAQGCTAPFLSWVMSRLNGLWWRALKRHKINVDSQLELSGDGATPDNPDPPRGPPIYGPTIKVETPMSKNVLTKLWPRWAGGICSLLRRSRFGNNRIKIKALKEEIQAIQACPHSDVRSEKITEL